MRTKYLFISLIVVIFSHSINISYSQLPIIEDSTQFDESITITTLTPEEFQWAERPRYTFSGRLPNLETKIRPLETSLFAGAITTFMVTQHIVQVNTIWSETGKFQVIEDGDYALYADKWGHFYGAYLGSYGYTAGFLESGFDIETATILGTVLGLSYSTYIEIMDGFADGWGFSPSDWYANAGGAALHLLQYYFPVLQNITPKFMYFPPKWHGENDRQPSGHFIDNYSAHTLWFSVNVHNLLPDTWQAYWPPWLELSFGYAVRNLCNNLDPTLNCNPLLTDDINRNPWGQRRYILALDYDLVRVIPECGWLCNWLVQSANHFKLPSPALEFGKDGTKFMIIYPFGTIK